MFSISLCLSNFLALSNSYITNDCIIYVIKRVSYMFRFGLFSLVSGESPYCCIAQLALPLGFKVIPNLLVTEDPLKGECLYPKSYKLERGRAVKTYRCLFKLFKSSECIEKFCNISFYCIPIMPSSFFPYGLINNSLHVSFHFSNQYIWFSKLSNKLDVSCSSLLFFRRPAARRPLSKADHSKRPPYGICCDCTKVHSIGQVFYSKLSGSISQ